MLQPKKTKYRKQFKGRIHGLAKGGTLLNFGSYGLKAVEPERITARQIEAARREWVVQPWMVRRSGGPTTTGQQGGGGEGEDGE